MSISELSSLTDFENKSTAPASSYNIEEISHIVKSLKVNKAFEK
jgi:hypothetical protein